MLSSSLNSKMKKQNYKKIVFGENENVLVTRVNIRQFPAPHSMAQELFHCRYFNFLFSIISHSVLSMHSNSDSNYYFGFDWKFEENYNGNGNFLQKPEAEEEHWIQFQLEFFFVENILVHILVCTFNLAQIWQMRSSTLNLQYVHCT